MSEDQAIKNTDTVLHENVDCRIILTAQHALGINVGGSVIVLDPMEWHRRAQSERKTIETQDELPDTHVTFRIGDKVRKVRGSQWKGSIVGWYSTQLTKEGYAVESDTELGSVQIYPASALELVR